MILTGKITGALIDFATGKPKLELSVNEVNDFKQLVDELKDKERLSIEVKQYREKRSLNANNYAWKLITEIANVLRASKEEIYFMMLKMYGQSEIISVLAHIPLNNYVKYFEEAGESTLNGKLFKHYRVFKGSSEFDSREMAIFIDGIISEAKNLNIQTETPNQIAEMKARWGE
jgi:hypothetical protein